MRSRVVNIGYQLANRSVPTPTDNKEGPPGATTLFAQEAVEVFDLLRLSPLPTTIARKEMITDGMDDMEAVYHEDTNGNLLINTTPENVSVVGSSLTENRSFNKDNEDFDTCSTGDKIHSLDDVGNTIHIENGKKNVTRYFIIKSLTHRNIQMSVEKGVWATQVMNEPILEEAFHNSDRVILIFSVNMSGFFQGYAQMVSSLGLQQDNVWNSFGTRNKPWGRSFQVKWLRLQDLPLQKTLHLKNPLNNFKPVKISRDCQELAEDIGEALCALFDEEAVVKRKLNRNDHLIDTAQKRPFRTSKYNMSEICVPFHPSMDFGMAGATPLHLPYAHQHSSFYREHIASFSHASPAHMKAKGFSSKKENNPIDAADVGGFASSLCEEDILDMTYEEYLHAIRRTSVSSSHTAEGTSGNPHCMQMNKYHDGSL